MDETVFYQGQSTAGEVFVSNARVSLGGKTFATANVTSVGHAKVPVKRGLEVIIGIIGILVIVPVPVLGVILLVAAVAAWFLRKPEHIVRIGSASGEVDGLRSKDPALVDRIVAAVNDAIVHRG